MEKNKAAEALGNLLASFEMFNERAAAEALSAESQDAVSADIKSEMERISSLCPSYDSAIEFAARLSLLQRTFFRAAPKAIEDVLHVAALDFVNERKVSPIDGENEIDNDQIMQVFGPVMMGMIRQRVDVHFRGLNNLMANSVRLEAKKSAVKHGSSGGQERAKKFMPLKLRALELARAGRFSSANHAATQIAPTILAMPEAKAIAFSSGRAVQTIAAWLRKEELQFPTQRADSSGD